MNYTGSLAVMKNRKMGHYDCGSGEIRKLVIDSNTEFP